MAKGGGGPRLRPHPLSPLLHSAKLLAALIADGNVTQRTPCFCYGPGSPVVGEVEAAAVVAVRVPNAPVDHEQHVVAREGADDAEREALAAAREAFAAWVDESPEGRLFGQVVVRPISGGGYVARNADDRDRSKLAAHDDPRAAREISKLTGDGEYRPVEAGEPTADAAGPQASASERVRATIQRPSVRTRLVQIPLGARWAVVPRGGWWLAHDVAESSWTLLPVNDAVGDADPLRVVFIDATGDVVTERGVGPTRSAAQQDHSLDFELVAGAVPQVLDNLRKGPMRVCEPGNRTLCVWLSLNELDEGLANGAFGPHPLDTPPMGYVGYCPRAKQFQGSVTSGRYRTDGSWAGGPAGRGLDRYTVRFEAGMGVVDLNEHVTGEPATGEPDSDRADCRFAGTRQRGRAN